MGEMIYCPKCKKTLDEKNFYTKRDKTKIDLCKKCLTMHVKSFEPETFLWILEKLDVPYSETEWNKKRDATFAKYNGDLNKINGSAVLGKYLATMKLKQWKDKGWADTEQIKAEEEAKLQSYLEEHQEMVDYQNEIKEKYENGEISESQYKTLMDTQTLAEEAKKISSADYDARIGGSANPYNENNFLPQEELIDIGAELSKDDKIYLAMKWGRTYQPDEWVKMEQMYNDFMKAFGVSDPAREDTLKKICKTSLKMDQAIDIGDIEGYQKLTRTYDVLTKSGKFTEAQNKKDDGNGEFDCVGLIVKFCESKKGGGKIERFSTRKPLDEYDEMINLLKMHNTTLVENDPTIKQKLEEWFKKRENYASQQKDLEEAKKMGLQKRILTDEDIIALKQYEEKQRKEDAAFESEGD